MRGDRIRFSHLLPLIDLAVLVVLVFVPITLTAFHLYEAAEGSDQAHIHTGQTNMTLPRGQIIPFAIRVATMPRAHTIMAINLPGSLIQKLISLLSRTSRPAGWHPQALALETWQALVFPFFALPFWWLAGCGIDGLVYKERLHWPLLLAGTLLFGLCLAALSRLYFPMPAADRVELSLWRSSFAGWTIAFATLPTAWILQSLRRDAEHANTPASS